MRLRRLRLSIFIYLSPHRTGGGNIVSRGMKTRKMGLSRYQTEAKASDVWVLNDLSLFICFGCFSLIIALIS